MGKDLNSGQMSNLVEIFHYVKIPPIPLASVSLSLSKTLPKMKTLLHFFRLLMTVKLVHLCVIAVPIHSHCNEDEQSSLLRLKQSLVYKSSASPGLESWNSSIDCCFWDGVTCTGDHVVALDISGQSISRGIDNSSSLFELQYLQSLKYADNGFHLSRIPSAIGKLTNLRYLNLSSNAFFGQVPIEISCLTSLVILDISGDYGGRLTLENPNLSMLVQNLPKLTELYLDGVNISSQGTNWCQAISSSLPNLRVLSMSRCQLSGPIDQSLAKLSSLSVIRLDSNDIFAPVPGFLANFSNLTFLSLGFCRLRGTFPKEIFQVSTLQTIDLSDNRELQGSFPEFPQNGSLQFLFLTYTNFSGSLPDSIGNLKMLSTIRLSGCNFYGSIPKSMENLTQLVIIAMEENKFSGSISSSHWENLINLVSLDLSSNQLDGAIPSSLFSLPSLETLVLFNNTFSGKFHEFPNVTSSQLRYVYLGSNNLEGPIPMSIFNLRGLGTLSLSLNNLSGSFPLEGLQQLRNLSNLDLSYNSLLIEYRGTNSSDSSFPQMDLLSLASNKMTKFPDFLRNQLQLSYLDLSANQIQGEIPNWIWKLNALEVLNLSCNSLVALEGPLVNLSSNLQVLDLHSNHLQRQMPIFSSPSLHYLDYSRNHFSSSIPTDIGDFYVNATFFSLSSNNLHGFIPESICNSKSLEILNLSNNSLSGMVPRCLTTLRTLAVLNLRRNNLTDNYTSLKFPEDCSLKTLDMSRNQMQGQFPKSLAHCTKLEVLNLGNNLIEDTFPCVLKNISTLHVLILRFNKFYGGIGCSNTNGTWPLLQIIDLAHNNFDGEVPGTSLATWQAMVANDDAELSHLQFQDDKDDEVYYQDAITVTSKSLEMDLEKILSFFTSIDFSCNKFKGPIPEQFGKFKSLHVLNLSNNAFTGTIPSLLSNSRQLESLDLSKNNLSGQIPPELANLSFLSFLNLSSNQLVGRIPSGTQFSTFPKASFEGNANLWGPPLSADNITVLSPPTSERSHSNSRYKIDWDLLSAEIGFIFGFGIAIGSLVFFKGWRKWYYKAMYGILVKIFPQLDQRIGNHRRHIHINQRWRG